MVQKHHLGDEVVSALCLLPLVRSLSMCIIRASCKQTAYKQSYKQTVGMIIATMQNRICYCKSQVGCPECKTAKVSRDLNPPIESKLSRDNLDSIGGFKSRDTLQFCIPSLDRASNLKNTVTNLI